MATANGQAKKKAARAKRTSQSKRTKKVPHAYICGSCGGHLTPVPGTAKPNDSATNFVKLNALTADVMDTPTRTLMITATVKNAATWTVNLDGKQLPITAGQPYSLPVSLGGHRMIGYVWGDPGAALVAKGTVGGSQVVDCEPTVLPNGQPAADPEDFTVV
jgi:hypothetical protein